MPKLPDNRALSSSSGFPLTSLSAVNRLQQRERESIYSTLLPRRLLNLLNITPESSSPDSNKQLIQIVAPEGLNFVRINVRANRDDRDSVFFAELTDTQFHQMELAFCIICDPAAPRFAVDVTEAGAVNYFASHGRNLPEELRAMHAGLFPNQTRRGLQMFSEFFQLVEQFTDRLGMEMIVAEPLTYDNAIRYEKYGFDYLTGRRKMVEINTEFQRGGKLFRRLDGSSPFRQPGMEKSVHGRSWAIHDGIMDEPWDGIQIYKMIGVHAGLNTFPDRYTE
jgi:hypothetical protein